MASAYIVMEKEDDPRARGTLNVSIEQLKKITIEIEYKVKQLTRSSFSFTIAAFIFARWLVQLPGQRWQSNGNKCIILPPAII
jgi:hypothetical protein